MITLETKLFVQLKPSKETALRLVALQKAFHSPLKLIRESSLHVTVLHLGKLTRIFEEVTALSPITQEKFIIAVDTFSNKLQSLVGQYTGETWEIKPVGIAKIGNTATQVLFLLASDKLRELHQQSMLLFREFLKDCGVEDYTLFVFNSMALAHSDILLPHVSMAVQKEKLSTSPLANYQPMHFTLDTVQHDR